MKNNKFIFLVLLLLIGCNNRHATEKDKFFENAKIMYHQTILDVLSKKCSLAVSNSVEIELACFLEKKVLLKKSNTGMIVINPDIKSWQLLTHSSRSNEVASVIQWINTANKPEYYSINFNGLLKPISQKDYIDSIKFFGKQDTLIVIQ